MVIGGCSSFCDVAHILSDQLAAFLGLFLAFVVFCCSVFWFRWLVLT